MDRPALDVSDVKSRVSLVPATVEVVGDESHLDDQYIREIGAFDLTPLFFPKARECFFVLAHDNAGVRAPDGVATVEQSARCILTVNPNPPG